RAVLIEAKDSTGNRTLCTVPILREAVADKGGFGGRKFAVLVGVSWYRHNEGELNNLQFADADANAMKAWLRTAGGGDFKDDDIECLTNQNATLAAVEAAINRFLTKAGENDLIYLFLAGHGAPDPYDRQSLYFLLHDSKVTDLPRTAFPMKKLGEFMDRHSKSVRLIAFFDTCHSAGVNAQSAGTTPAKATSQGDRGVGSKSGKPGSPVPPPNPPKPIIKPASVSGFDFYNADLFKQKGWTVMTSSGMNELSQESARWGSGHGVFTWALLEGAQGKADANGDCRITAEELSQFVSATVRRETDNRQSPQSLPGGSRDLVVATAPCQRPTRQ
ncbi:MAG: caspase family protein, partial [Acidobacteriota bacterium]